MSRAHKYNAVKTELDGFTFDSKREAAAYSQLKLLERGGAIRGLERQVRFPLNGCDRDGKPEKVCVYVADFVAQEVATGKTIVYDAKGMRTAMYRLKKKWFELQYGLEITEL